MSPIQIPNERDHSGLILFEEFCQLIRTPQRAVRDWGRGGLGPRWRFNGIGRLYATVAETRRSLTGRHSSPAPAGSRERSHG